MLTFNLKSVVTVFLIAFILGFCSSFLFRGCSKETDDKVSTVVIKPQELKKQADNNDREHLEKIAALQKRYDELENELKTTRTELSKAKQRAAQKANTIKKIIEPKGYAAKDLIRRTDQMRTIPIDSSLQPCDTLAKQVMEYIQENQVKDSLYETQIEKMDSVVSIKDSIIQNHNQVYDSLHQLFNKAIEQQELLIQANKQLKRDARKKKFGGTLKTIGIMIATGVVTHYLNR